MILTLDKDGAWTLNWKGEQLVDRRVTLNHCQCTSPCPSQNCCSSYDVHQTLLHSNHWEPFSSDEDMKNVLGRTVPLTCPSFTSECEESPRAVNCDAASLAAARCLAATWHFETNQNKAWKGLRVCASLFCARVSVCLCFWGVCTSSIMWMPVVMLKLIMISQLTGGLCSFAPCSLLQSVSLLKWIKEKTQSLFRDSWASYTSTDYLLQSKALYTFSGDKLAM